MNSYKIKKGFVINTVGQKTTIFDSEGSLLYTFNKTASYIFNKIKKKKERKEIVFGLAKKFSVSHDRAKQDVGAFIEELIKKKIIEI